MIEKIQMTVMTAICAVVGAATVFVIVGAVLLIVQAIVGLVGRIRRR